VSEVDEGRRALITAGLMVATFMGGIDATVVNVALPHIQGSLSASSDQITWMLTSYMVAMAVGIPISSWLADKFGLKTMLAAGIAIFTGTSLLCGLSTTLPEMVFLRVLQGLAFAPIAPLSQAALLKINPPERFGRAMAVFAMATVAAPIVGPALGGYITETLSWRWCFYINLPVGLVALLLVWISLPSDTTRPRRFDFLGYASLAIAIGALQLFLDRGPSQDWFDSPEILIEALVATSALWIYVTHTLSARTPLFDRALFRDRNFVAGAGVLFLVMLILFSSVSLMPLMTQNLMGYPAMAAGLINVPRALVIIAVLQMVGRLDTVVDRRLMAAVGLTILSYAFWRMAYFDLSMGTGTIIAATMIQGLGQGMVTVPVTTLTLATIRPGQRADASTLINLFRNLGGSVGVAWMQATMVVNGQAMHASLAAHVTPDSPAVRAGLTGAFSPDSPAGALALNAEITRQADMIAFVDNYWLMIGMVIVCCPLLLLLRQPRAAARMAG
jgi:DHA2 family multidrug resistance protein